MMRLKFSVEDILRVEKINEKMFSSQSHSSESKKVLTSDGESVRSESPDSIVSCNSDDVSGKSGRRMRTMIRNWQKSSLETAFQQQQYPTVQQFEGLSKELGLPHYVTKVWFQNRRSKFRKEGNREKIRSTVSPYPSRRKDSGMPDDANQYETYASDNVPAAIRSIDFREPPILLAQNTCHCLECINDSKTKEETLMPKLIPKVEVCSCEECLAKSGVQHLQQQFSRAMTVEQQQQLERERSVHILGGQQGHLDEIYMKTKQDFCSCQECLFELQKAKTEEMYLKSHHHNTQYRSLGAPSSAQCQLPRFDDRRLQRLPHTQGNTLHYIPHHNNFDTIYNQNQRCVCKHCRPEMLHFK